MRKIVFMFLCFYVFMWLALPARAQGVDIGEWFKLGEKGIREVFPSRVDPKCFDECCDEYDCIEIDWRRACRERCLGVDLGSFISAILPNVYTIAGIILLFLLIFGGFTYIVNAGKQDTEGVQKGKNAITAAVIGFALIFGSWWIIQIIEVITGMDILK